MRWPASTNRRLRSAWVATTVPLPGSARPSASVRQFIELAVNMPEQEPQVGQAERSITSTSSSLTLESAAATMASIRSTALVLPLIVTLPASIGPPETNTAGMLRRSAAISMPGVILSQLEMQTMRVGAMRVDHVFDAVGDQLARRQAVEHAVMAHGDAVIDRDGVEFLGDAAGLLDLAGDELAEVLQMDVAGHELGEGVDDRDDRLAEIAVLHAGGAPEAAGAGHVAAVGGGAGAIGGHGGFRPRV